MKQKPNDISKVYTSLRLWPWTTMAEVIPVPVWDEFRRWRWRLLAPILRKRVERKAAEVHWLFVVGCSNSGTTLLSQILSAHPEIGALPYEGQFMTPALPRSDTFDLKRLFSERLDLFRFVEDQDSPDGQQVLYDWLRGRDRGRGRFLMEKSPPDILRTRWLQAQAPSCSFVAIVRNGFAVCEGIRRRTGCDLRSAARHWALANDYLIADSAHLRRFHLLRYEDLCEQPESTLDAVADFLGLDAGPLHAAQGATWQIHNVNDRPSPLANFNLASLKRLSEEDFEIIRDEAGPALARFGYSSDALSEAMRSA